MKTEYKLESGEWGSLIFERNTYFYSDPSQWKMITERKDHWHSYEHPDATYKGGSACWCTPDTLVCPYCHAEQEPEDYREDDGAIQCRSCEKEFTFSASFGYGSTTKAKPCQFHEWVFLQQYAHFSNGHWSTWRNMGCLHCEETFNSVLPQTEFKKVGNHHEFVPNPNHKVRTLLPWLNEYNNPDFFDPRGILKAPAGMNLRSKLKTPILDMLRGKSKRRPWTSHEAERAIINHENIYGEL